MGKCIESFTGKFFLFSLNKKTYYYDIPTVQGKITESQNQILETLTTNYYNQTQTNTLITNTSNYALNISNILKTNIDTKEAILTFSSPLTRNTNTIGIDLSSYLNNSTAARETYSMSFLGSLSRRTIHLFKSYGLIYKFPCSPNQTKFSGNVSFGSRMLQKKFGTFSQRIGYKRVIS